MIHVVAKSTHVNPRSVTSHTKDIGMERQSYYRRYIRLCVTACGGHGSLHGCDAALARNLDAHTHRIARRRNDRSLRALLEQELCLLRCVWNAAFSSVCTRVRTRPRGVKTYMLSKNMRFRVQWAANGYAPVSFSCLVWMREIPEPSFEKIVCAASSTASGNTSTNTRSAPLNCHART